MLVLLTSIMCSVAVSILLKLARRFNLDIAQAIAMNYAVAASLCWLLLQPDLSTWLTPNVSWWVLIALGLLLPSIFLVMAAAVRQAGLVLSDAAQRLSLFLPLLAAVLIFGEVLDGYKSIGILLAGIALICLVWKPNTDPASLQASRLAPLLLLGVWLGYGVIDILFKQLAKQGAAFASSLMAAFILAGILLLVYLVFSSTRWQAKNLVAGVILGLLNFGNIYFYIRAHQIFPDNPTLVFSAMNIGVITLGTLVGAGWFKEKLTWHNILGIALAISAILLLLPTAT